MHTRQHLSVVVPVYRGERSIAALVAELEPLHSEPQATPAGFRYQVDEVLLVHDCGPDRSDQVLEQLQSRFPFVRAIWLSRNFGQHAATLAGMAAACGDWVATLDEDGQQDPASLAAMLDTALGEGLQLVYAEPVNPPPHGPLRNFFSRLAKRLTGVLLGNNRIGRFNSFRLVEGEVARTLALAAWAQRAALNQGGTPVDAALQQARAAAQGPVVLFDVGDNVGGGSPGDSTLILHAARRLGVSGLLQALCDPGVVRQCQALGVGGRIVAEVGGKSDGLHGAPFAVQGRITALSDGRYEETGPTHGGFRYFDDGPSAALQTDDGHTLVLTSRSAGSASLQQFRALGIEPTAARIIVAKGVHSPRPAMEPIARQLIWVATAGVTSADLGTFDYRHRRVPLYPLEPDTRWP